MERPLRNHETDTAAKGGRAQLPPLTSSPRIATRTKLFRTKINSNKRINGPEARKVAMQIRSCRARRKDPKLEDNGWGSLGAPAGVPLPTGARKEQHGGLRPVLANKPVSAHAVSDGQPATPASLKQRGLERQSRSYEGTTGTKTKHSGHNNGSQYGGQGVLPPSPSVRQRHATISRSTARAERVRPELVPSRQTVFRVKGSKRSRCRSLLEPSWNIFIASRGTVASVHVALVSPDNRISKRKREKQPKWYKSPEGCGH